MSRPTPTGPWPGRASSKGPALIGRQAPRPNSRSGPSDCPLARDCARARLYQYAMPKEPAFCRASSLLCIPVLRGTRHEEMRCLLHRMLFLTWSIAGGRRGGAVAWLQVEIVWVRCGVSQTAKQAEGLNRAIDTRHCGGSPSQADDDDVGNQGSQGREARGASTPHSQDGAALEIGMSIGVITRCPHPLRRKC